MEMKFKTDRGDYKVLWVSSGWSYADALVYKLEKVRFLCFTYSRYTFVWKGSQTKLKVKAERMLPTAMRNWFKLSIYEYEEYRKEWDKLSDGESNEQIL